jgi:lipid A 3-O-deacylase
MGGEATMGKLLGLAFFSLFALRADAIDGISVEYGLANRVEMTRLGVAWLWDRSWLSDGDWQLTGFWEATLGRWRGHRPNDNNQTITEIGITPVFRFSPKVSSGLAPYVEGGFVGLHLISPTFIYNDRKFGSAFQFGNHVGFGISFGEKREFDLGYRFQHVSNGDIKQPNQGINFSQLHFIYRF